MPENFLSFISNVDAKSADASLSENVRPAERVSQGTEFNNILVKEQAKVQGANRAGEMVRQGREQAMTSPEVAHVEERSDVPPNPEAPVALPTGPVSGNPLPELSIHSAALKVGRVILTTAKPKVSEESLSQFARSQGADVPPLTAGVSDENITITPQGPNTQNILQGLMGGQGQPATSHPDQPLATKGLELSATKQSLGPEALQVSRPQFVQRTGISQANVADTKNMLPAAGLPLNKSMNASSTQQPSADSSSAAAKEVDTRKAAPEPIHRPSAGLSRALAKGFETRKAASERTQPPIGDSSGAAAKEVDTQKTASKLTQQPSADLSRAVAKGVETQKMASELTQQPSADLSRAVAKGVETQKTASELTQQPSADLSRAAAKEVDTRKTASERTQPPIGDSSGAVAKELDTRKTASVLTQQPSADLSRAAAKGIETQKTASELTQQPSADLSRVAARGFEARQAASELTQQPISDVSGAAAKAVGTQNVTPKYPPNPSAGAEFMADKSLNEGRVEAKPESIAAHTALGGSGVEKPVLMLTDGAQDGMPQHNQSQSFEPPASTPVNAQGGLIQAPVTNVHVGLADALMSSDPAQMQSRLQPYQAWTQRFGEVLAQKLALAVKDGNWTVKLNLNPASLGPVGVELQVRDGGIEGQLASSDPNVRQLLGDSMPKLRQSLEALVGEQGGVNIELGDGRDRGAKRGNEQEIELSMDLLADELVPSQQDMASGNILRDGLNVFV